MSLRVWLKSKVADRVLAPVREHLKSLIEPGSSVLDIGCGTGDLLFRTAPMLSSGCGIDIDPGMINYARDRKREEGTANIDFICSDVRNAERRTYDISTSTLCLHEMVTDTAIEVLQIMVSSSKMVLIADYTSANALSARLGIEFDEMISGHYGRFRAYRKCGEVPYYARQVGASIVGTIATDIDGISIWVIEGQCP